ncbi:Ras-GEF domain-containing family member 1B-A [Exaiptasia diaphana]|nr:Ras-GEF domain-containing family member 1B-A [Exaiptasia diaphana]
MITAKLLEAERRKLSQLQHVQCELESVRERTSSIDRTKEVERQKLNYARLSLQHNRLAKEYEDAARGLLRRSTKQKKSSRSLPSLGFKQTVKARPTIFGGLVDETLRSEGMKKESNGSLSHYQGPLLSPKGVMSDAVTYQDGRLISGTLDALIEKLVPSPKYYPDRTYIFAFLLCCRLFISPSQLLSRVSAGCAKTMKKANPDDARKLGSNLVQLMSEWTETFTNDFRDEVMMMHFKDITTYCSSLSTELKKLVSQITQSLFSKLAALDKYDEVLTQASAAAEDRRRTNSSKYKSVLEMCVSPSEMAQQLSHIELVRSDTPSEKTL